MEFEIIPSIEALDRLREEWNALLVGSAGNTPFLRHEYQRAWFAGLGGGEWPRGELRVVTARRPADPGEAGPILTGIAPFFQTRNEAGEPALVLLGGIEISDQLDWIVRPEDLAEFTQGVCETLENETWRTLDLYNLPEDSPTLSALRTACEARGWDFTLEPFRPSMHVALPGDWEGYLAGIDKKQRHEIRRKMRRAEESGLGVRWYIVSEAGALEAEMEAFLTLMAHDAAKAAFLDEPMRAQMKAIMRAAFENGWLQLAFLEVDGSKACGYLNFDYNNRIWVYNSGLDPRFMDLSPGWVLLGYLLRWANENRRAEFDFMRGDEDYKVKFGGRRRDVMRVRVTRDRR